MKWKGVFSVTGDFNIDLLGEEESTQRYKNLLHTFSLCQHITKATRKNKTLIDHISSNMKNKLLQTDILMTNEMTLLMEFLTSKRNAMNLVTNMLEMKKIST